MRDEEIAQDRLRRELTDLTLRRARQQLPQYLRRRLRELRDGLFARPEWTDRAGLLSMGMSVDFEVAIEEGATHVRVGSALFGRRDS